MTDAIDTKPAGEKDTKGPAGKKPGDGDKKKRNPEDPLTRKELWWLFGLAAVMSFLVLLFGGLALRAYAGVRFKDYLQSPAGAWWDWLLIFAGAGAIAVGALAVSWRLAHRKYGSPRWGLALAVLAVVLFGLLVWPTPWTYREYGCKIFQINRFLGRIYELPTKVPGCDPEAAARP